MKVCPLSEKENPISVNHCMQCGNVLSPSAKLNETNKIFRELNEVKKTNELLKSALESQHKKEEGPTEGKPEIIIIPLTPPAQKINAEPKTPDKSNKKTLRLIFLLSALALIIFGIFYYNNIYLSAKIDRVAPRYYTFADKTVLRSTKDAGVDYSKIASLKFDSELMTYSHYLDGWSEVLDASINKGYFHLIICQARPIVPL